MDSNKSRVVTNTIFLYIRMFITLIVSLYTSRVVLYTLGVKDFGIYNVVGGIVVLFSFLSNSLTQATQRYLSFALGENNEPQFVRIFSTSILLYSFLAIIITIIAEILGLYLLYNYLEIPSERFNAALITFHFSVLTFCVSILKIPYNAVIIAYERMNFYAYISILEVFLKLAIVYILSIANYDKLIFYSTLTLIVTFIINIGYYIFCKRNYKNCKFHIHFENNLFHELLKFSGWSTLGSFSVILSTQGINLLMNVFFGVVVNAAMGIANQISGTVNLFVSNFQTAFNPLLIKTYAANDIKTLKQSTYLMTKISFFLLAIIILPILIETEPILQLWLKSIPDYLISFTRYTLIIILLDSFSGPLYTVLQASGNIKKYQLAITILYLASFFISWYIYYLGGYVYSSFIIRIIFSTIASFFIRIYLVKTKTLMNINIFSFVYNIIFKSILAFLICLLTLALLHNYTNINSPLCQIISITCYNIIIFSILFYSIVLEANERKIICDYIIKKIKNKNE